MLYTEYWFFFYTRHPIVFYYTGHFIMFSVITNTFITRKQMDLRYWNCSEPQKNWIFFFDNYRCLMCAPWVTQHPLVWYYSSCHTCVNMCLLIFFTAAMICAFRHPCLCVYGKNLNIVPMCAVSPVVHTSNISSCYKKKLIQFSCCCEQFQ
jgi:hypothetical protein